MPEELYAVDACGRHCVTGNERAMYGAWELGCNDCAKLLIAAVAGKVADKIDEWHTEWAMDCLCGSGLAEHTREHFGVEPTK